MRGIGQPPQPSHPSIIIPDTNNVYNGRVDYESESGHTKVSSTPLLVLSRRYSGLDTFPYNATIIPEGLDNRLF